MTAIAKPRLLDAKHGVCTECWVTARRQAATLSLPPLAFPWEAFPWTGAMVTFARALGLARTGDLGGAQTELDRLVSAREAAKAKDKYWAAQIEVERQAATAMLARAQGSSEEALAGMHGAADLEASMDKHPVTPGAIIPMRELLGDLLLEMDQPAQALGEYERALTARAPRQEHRSFPMRVVWPACCIVDPTFDPDSIQGGQRCGP